MFSWAIKAAIRLGLVRTEENIDHWNHPRNGMFSWTWPRLRKTSLNYEEWRGGANIWLFISTQTITRVESLVILRRENILMDFLVLNNINQASELIAENNFAYKSMVLYEISDSRFTMLLPSKYLRSAFACKSVEYHVVNVVEDI